jgi:hypothetical protein
MNSSFDLIVDKGTLDAVLVEGSVYQMLAIVYNLLTIGGVYLICSLHEQEMISSLLGLYIFTYLDLFRMISLL